MLVSVLVREKSRKEQRRRKAGKEKMSADLVVRLKSKDPKSELQSQKKSPGKGDRKLFFFL